ncbi:hypothetical protein GRF29_28g1558063 [Pseudopithomyces chartarum]|uniref:Acetylxylan esterase n=1 Tax=Pseudopithomyces chartarum TaxID=1892770 RepID=A0AAN6M435_9PLEO|nr:hypothetical protein GRF29_28g1558063 [Pseudopithomyces chartarum]
MRHSLKASALLLGLSVFINAQKCPDYGIRECTAPEILALETDNCTDYHIFVARGSDSAYPGHQGDLIHLVCDGIDASCNYENIIYPANSSWSGEGVWCPSAEKGTKNGRTQMQDYAERCPDSKLILFGYSQGASVALDILGGGGGAIYDCEQDSNPALDRSTVPGSHLLAAAVFGAPRRTANQTYSHGDGANYNGTAARTEEQLAGLAPYSDVLREYCNYGDPICAPGTEPMVVENHWSYFEKFQDEVAEWVIKISKEDEDQGKNNSSSTSKSATTATATSKLSTGKPTASATETLDVQNNAAETTSADATGTAPKMTWGAGGSLGALVMGIAIAVSML